MDRGTMSTTARRCLGAMLLLPVAVAIFLGQPASGVMLFALAGVMAWETSKLVGGGRFFRVTTVLLVGVAAFPHVLLDVKVAPLAIIVLSGLAGAMVWFWSSILVAGFVACLCLCLWYAGILLAQPDGHFLLLALSAVIAACDIGAYFAGRRFGGPKLMPSVSPNKTVSGSVGGVVAAVIVGIVVFAHFGEASSQRAVLFSVAIAIAAQAGDLFESAVKRHLGVKDSGAILPGHGGVLDRFDGYLLVIPLTHLFLYGL